MHKILTIVGARPQFIKAAAVSHAILEKYSDRISEDILHTGQHYDDSMSGRFFTELDIPQPRYNLGVGSGNHGGQTAAMLKGIEEVLLSEHYDGVIVYGDTNSTLAGALAAAKLHIPVFHVEAGLRSFNRAMPEEINRVLTDHVSTLLFAPTQTAVQNLRNEGFSDKQIVFSGDVMLDNVLYYRQRLTPPTPPQGGTEWTRSPQGGTVLPFSSPLEGGKGGVSTDCRKSFILATVHRDFNTDNTERLNNILSALNAIADKYDATILFPVHPRTRKHLNFIPTTLISKRIKLVEPLSYLETLHALMNAHLVLTDSGGLQKEAYFSSKPCVVLRPETEWVEIVETGAAILADANPNRIVKAVGKLWDTTPPPPTQFGDGHAATHIINSIANL